MLRPDEQALVDKTAAQAKTLDIAKLRLVLSRIEGMGKEMLCITPPTGQGGDRKPGTHTTPEGKAAVIAAIKAEIASR